MNVREPTLEVDFASFKEGVYDAIAGHIRDQPSGHYYKRGYDFGMTIYSELLEEEE